MATITTTEQQPDWIAPSNRQRKWVMAALGVALLLHGLVYFNQRAIFMPWNAAEHPMVTPSPTAFFAQALPGDVGGSGARRGGGGPGLTGRGGGVDPVAFFAAPVGTPPPGEVLGLAPDAPLVALPDALAFAPIGTGGGDDVGAPSDPGTIPAAAPPTAFIGTAAVPETTTWAMLLLGFGLIGAVLRRRARPGNDPEGAAGSSHPGLNA